ncbi:MAG: ABC transporter ATP-binding protein [Solirubrobacterales bacterium]
MAEGSSAVAPPNASGATRTLEVLSLSHRFGKTEVLRGIDLEIRPGEFLGLLGPSGCGKSTLLRILAGFLRPSVGSVQLGGKDITGVPAEKRPVNMVFQRATLFPHLDVFENVAFGLRVKRTSRREVAVRVEEALEMVRLGSMIRRRAHELSGGQMQRVALARALVNRPEFLLLDEPLSALDLSIRLEMESELRRLHAETGATFVYVTHDQGEALSMADRVAVFSEGEIAQVGAPIDVYTAPSSSYVARFVGDANVIPVEVTSVDRGEARYRVAGMENSAPAGAGLVPGPAQLVVRAECVAFRGDGLLRGSVVDRAFRGAHSSYLLDVSGVERPLRAEVRSSADGDGDPDVGAPVSIGWDDGLGCVIPPEPAQVGADDEAAEVIR